MDTEEKFELGEISMQYRDCDMIYLLGFLTILNVVFFAKRLEGL